MSMYMQQCEDVRAGEQQRLGTQEEALRCLAHMRSEAQCTRAAPRAPSQRPVGRQRPQPSKHGSPKRWVVGGGGRKASVSGEVR